MAEFTQDQRLISIDSPLDKDELLLTSFEGVELISELFEFKIEVLSKNQTIKPEELIGKPLTVTIQNEIKRTFNGYVSQFAYGDVKAENFRTYRLTMVPWLWFLSKTNNHRIFQEKTTKDIIEQVFQDYDDPRFNDFEFHLDGNYEPREYCVQHNESDLNFISRLLEEEGIAYYFEQHENSHVMKIVDAVDAYEQCQETDLVYSKADQPNAQIKTWEHVYQFRKGKWSLNDYDFKQPTKNQLKTTPSTSKFASANKFEHYEYSPYHDFSGIGELSKKRIEAEETPLNSIEGSSDCSSFYAGGKFKLASHAVNEEQGTYIITAVSHWAYDDSYLSGQGGGSDYNNDFACIPDTVHFRPPLIHPKPSMNGPQSAVVVGPSGEEIYIDEYGRVKVQFHWDREGKKDDNSSCFLRVMQPWAGSGWGTSFIPRMGMEVVVNFFNGDPDRPFISGSVYNDVNKPPYASKTQSGIKTRSTRGGASSNCNEFRFEDEKGSEQFYLHAEKDMDTSVENNETLTVQHDRTKTIANDENSDIGKDRNKTVGENQSETIGKDKTAAVGENQSETIGKDKTISVGENQSESIGKDMSLEVGENLIEKIGKALKIEVGDEITLKTGSASIVMKKNGEITIKGKDITLKGSGKINVKASKDVSIKGSKISQN
jgi:type VI secretion system secreted protein VgrG